MAYFFVMKDTLFSNVKYLPVNERDKAWGLAVTTAGFQSIIPNTSYPPKGHPSRYWFNPSFGRTLPEYQLVYVTKGKGIFRSDSVKTIHVKAGNVILLFPGEWHTYFPQDEIGWDTYWLGFYGSYPDHLINHRFFIKKSPVLDIGFNERVAALFDQSIELVMQEKSGFQQAVSGIVLHLLGTIYYITQNNLFEDEEMIKKIEEARVIMREHPEGNVCLEDIAADLNMSYSWFRKMFKQYTGLSPAQYQLQIKLQKAKALLISSSKSVKEIAYLLDFDSPNYFASFFKDKTGFTPVEFRKVSHGKS